MAKIENHLYRSVRKDEFVDGVLNENSEAVHGLHHGDIDPLTVVKHNKHTIRQDWRRDRLGYFKTGHGTSLWDKKVFSTHLTGSISPWRRVLSFPLR